MPLEVLESTFQTGAKFALALHECDPELREEAINLLRQLQSKDLDDDDRHSTMALIAEILFPNADKNGLTGVDLVEAEEIEKSTDPVARMVLGDMDEQEAGFADRLRKVMTEKGLNQQALAEKVGLGQPAISMMLQRNCRPQQRTVKRLAEALEVSPETLWPSRSI